MLRHKLLSIFIENPEKTLSGEEISRHLGCSRAAVWKHIEELRQHGYEIEARPRSGYRLLYRPDRLAPEEIFLHLTTEKFGRYIRYFPTTISTQIEAHQWAKDGAPEGALVVAEEQSNGRGRMGKKWHSPPKSGIWMSLILRPSIPLAHASHLTLLASVAVQEALELETLLSVSIKWPNDLLINKKKVCGILTELRGEQDQIHYVIVGIGMNVNIERESFPPDLLQTATSLSIEKGQVIHRASLLATILKKFEETYDVYLQEGFEPIRVKWERKAGMLGKQITANTLQGTFVGIAHSLNEHGALLLGTEKGVVPVYSADIEI